MSKRPKLVYGSQRACVDAWLQQFVMRPEHEATRVPDVGRARGWYTATTLHFSGIHLYSNVGQSYELARMALTPKGQWVVMIRKARHQSQAVECRSSSVRWRAAHQGFVWVQVEQFEDHAANQAWYTARIAEKYGTWKRAREKDHKKWKFQGLDETVRRRTQYERVFQLKRTKEESEVRTARVVQALVGNG